MIPYPNYFENSKLGIFKLIIYLFCLQLFFYLLNNKELAPKISKEKNISKYFQLVDTYKTIISNLNKSSNEPRIFENIFDSLVWLTEHKDPGLLNQINSDNKILSINDIDFRNSANESITEEAHINVLITGSLYLVGLTLEVLNFQI